MKQDCDDSTDCNPDIPDVPSCCQESRCQIEALLSVDERGQMILPKDVRDKAKIKAGDKLALISWSREDVVLCFSLMKADDVGAFIKDYLGPVMGGSVKK